MLAEENSCPMCTTAIDVNALKVRPELINTFNNQQKEEPPVT